MPGTIVLAITTVSIIVMTVTVIMVPVTYRWTHNLIANIESDRFPEIPETPLCRLSRSDPLSQPTKDQKRQQPRDNLQHHEFGDLKASNLRKLHSIHRMTMRIDRRPEAQRQLEERKIPHMVKMILSGSKKHKSVLRSHPRTIQPASYNSISLPFRFQLFSGRKQSRSLNRKREQIKQSQPDKKLFQPVPGYSEFRPKSA